MIVHPYCRKCHTPLLYPADECGYCQDLPILKNRSLFLHEEEIKQQVKAWKFHQSLKAEHDLVCEIKKNKDWIRDEFQTIDMIVPIPLSIVSFFTRGFHPSLQISKVLESILLKPIHEVLHLTSPFTTVKKLSKSTRNTRKNPYYTKLSESKNILLVDDISTTFSTIRFASTTLKHSSHSTIYSFTLIRSMPKSKPI